MDPAQELKSEQSFFSLSLSFGEPTPITQSSPALLPPFLHRKSSDFLASPVGCILLGFTRDGGHLVSYTSTPVAAADGKEGCCLQLWSFHRSAPCRKLWNVPLFRTDTSLDQQGRVAKQCLSK